jgi:hypothetical protein
MSGEGARWTLRNLGFRKDQTRRFTGKIKLIQIVCIIDLAFMREVVETRQTDDPVLELWRNNNSPDVVGNMEIEFIGATADLAGLSLRRMYRLRMYCHTGSTGLLGELLLGPPRGHTTVNHL